MGSQFPDQGLNPDLGSECTGLKPLSHQATPTFKVVTNIDILGDYI